ncbi:Rpn family recombination-promoting nuclease/putative transposase [Pedobacter ginsengisoli]|uniref:Rpn family recombination-promoting nuclease/putative transposase n=1 Tax=Pedobacter ginsengisoli TaxID=363852 RepID=UPI00254A2A9F|nr:Rpn family recombination-promoting nuclease/putative transposase [Pedobacter ginsengisoli]
MPQKPSKYISPLLDFSFKKIFGSSPNKDLLIAFLNEIFKGRKVITDLIYNKNEHHGDNKEEATAVFDLLCTGNMGEKFIIEVQHSDPINFKKRGIYYTSRVVSEQAPKGKLKSWLYNITEVYFVAIIEKPIEKNSTDDRYLHDVCLCYRDTGEIFYEGLGYTYIDLSNFVKTEQECSTQLDTWLYSLKHMDEMDELPAHLKKTIFEKLYNIAEYSKMSKEEQKMYDQNLKRKWDNEAAFAFREEKGKYEGRLEGKLEEKIEVASKMIAEGIAVELISKCTGLSVEEIAKLHS